jgi:hypothetical protein
VRAGKKAAGQRRPRDDAEVLASVLTQRQHGRLLVAVHEIVLTPCRDEPLAVVDIGSVERRHQDSTGHLEA